MCADQKLVWLPKPRMHCKYIMPIVFLSTIYCVWFTRFKFILRKLVLSWRYFITSLEVGSGGGVNSLLSWKWTRCLDFWINHDLVSSPSVCACLCSLFCFLLFRKGRWLILIHVANEWVVKFSYSGLFLYMSMWALFMDLITKQKHSFQCILMVLSGLWEAWTKLIWFSKEK